MVTKKRTTLEDLVLQPEDHVEEVRLELPKPPKAKKIQQTAYLPIPVHEQLRTLAFEERLKMHSLLMEGLDLVFKDRGLPSIADLQKTP